MDGDVGVSVDIGGTKIRVCVGEASGRVLWRKAAEMPLPPDVDRYVEEVVTRVREGVEHVPEGKAVAGIGVASVGPLDIKRGGMASPANLPYESVPLVGPLQAALGSRVLLMNDANAAALGESVFGAGKGVSDMVFITISTGIGGGAIVDGHLLIGKDGNAAEIGHLVVDSSERLTCGCGRKGHWEAYCSGKNIPKFAAFLAEGVPGVERDDTSPSILKAAAAGDPFATRVVGEMGKLNALGVANVVNMFDPSLITIGGGVALNNRELVLGPIRGLLPSLAINRVPRVVITPLGDDAGLMGGLALALGLAGPGADLHAKSAGQSRA